MKIKLPEGRMFEYSPKDEINFPLGIVGFGNLHKFVLSEFVPKFKWMVSTEEEDKIFLVADPYKFCDDYEFNLSIEDKSLLDVESIFSTQIFAIVTVPDDYFETSLNLSAPIVINPDTKVGKQVVLNSKKYNYRFSLLK